MSETVADHLSIKSTRFFMQIIGMWYTTKKFDGIVSNLLLIFAVVTLTSGVIIVVMELWSSWGDLAAVSYNAPCSTSGMQELSKLATFVYYRRQVLEFNKFTENTFWNVKYDRLDLDILEKCNRMCLWACGVSFILMQSIAWYYLFITVIENQDRNETDRQLPFRIWLDVPFTVTPWFEITFTLEMLATFYTGICSTTFAVFLFTINLYASGQFEILQRKLEISSEISLEIHPNLSREKSKNFSNNAEIAACDNLKKCLKHHQLLIRYIERVENLYCYIMLGQALGGVLQICFSSFQIVLGAEVSLQRTGLSIVFLVGSTIQLFLFSWSCHTIIEQSSAVAEAAYRSSWYNLPYTRRGKNYRQAILIMICRARKPCIITIGKFAPMSLQTFASVVNTSISYFTVLSQMRDDQ